jgi:hypothetical protein
MIIPFLGPGLVTSRARAVAHIATDQLLYYGNRMVASTYCGAVTGFLLLSGICDVADLPIAPLAWSLRDIPTNKFVLTLLVVGETLDV